MISEHDREHLPAVLDELEGAFVTGSYLVDKGKANDIDIVVSKTAWKLHYVEHYGSDPDEYRDVAGIIFKKQEEEDSSEYADEENEMYELCAHYRGGGLNILVIRDLYLPAYKAAAYALEASPKYYGDRESRVKIHQHFKGLIRKLLSDAAEGDDIPW